MDPGIRSSSLHLYSVAATFGWSQADDPMSLRAAAIVMVVVAM